MKFDKQKIQNWFKDPYNLAILGVVVLALAIRLYYFFQTMNQPLWYDEAEYMSTAKHWAFGVPFNVNPQRPPLFHFLSALIFKAGLGEATVRFLLILIPSFILVFLIYLLGKEMYSKKIGLIAALLSSVSWTFLFWTGRMQPDSFTMCFQVLSVFFMWKYWKSLDQNTPNSRFSIYAGIFAALGFYFKISALLVPLIFLVFILIKDRLTAFKNKDYYYFAIAFFLTLLPYFIWSYLTFATFTAFTHGYSRAIGTSIPFAWYTFNFFYTLTENIVFILFLVGLFIASRFLIYFDILLKDKKKAFDPGIFGMLVLIISSAFYIFYIRGTEDRWVFLWLPFIFFFVGDALTWMETSIKKYSKVLSIIVVLALLVFASYSQIDHANQVIKTKINSYLPVKEAAIWMKENTQSNESLMSISYTQTVYYSERKVYSYSEMNSSSFTDFINMEKPKYLTISVFEPHPDWIQGWIQDNQNRTKVANAYFADKEQKQPVLIVYQINYNSE